MADFAISLGGFLNMAIAMPAYAAMPRVADKTGLTGVYEIKLEFEGTAVVPGSLPAMQNTLPPQATPARSEQLFSRRLRINWA